MDNRLLTILLGEDDLGVVIRAHIHIEEYIEKFLILKTDFQYVKKMNLDFSEKLLLAVSLGFNNDLYAPLVSLSNIRNKFAHKTDSVLTKSDVNNLYKSFAPEHKEGLQEIIRNNSDRPEGLATKYADLALSEKFVLMVMSLDILLAQMIHGVVLHMEKEIERMESNNA